MASFGDYYNSLDKIVYDGDTAKAADLNSINTAVDTAFESVATDLTLIEDRIDSVADNSEKWATDPQGTNPDPLQPTEYSSKANAQEAKAWASGTGGVDTEADGTTAITRSAKEYASDTAADAASTAADVVATNADVVTTNANVAQTTADRVATGEDRVATNADAASTASDLAEFQSKYLGAFASAPAGPHDTGAIFWHIVTNSWWTWNGTQFEEMETSGTMRDFEYTLTQDQFVVTGADDNGNVLSLEPENILVYLNGRRLDSSDFTSDETSVTLLEAGDDGDILAITSWEIVRYVDVHAVLDAVEDAENSATSAQASEVAAQASEVAAEGFKDLAYQYSLDAQSVACQDLASVYETLVSSGDVVDVFIYDTSKDSDGGAWRKRCTHLSWYNETLNTSTRGTTREFPAVALIVAENNKVTIFDATEPTLPMWMIFDGDYQYMLPVASSVNNPATAVTALNGVIAVSLGGNTGFGVTRIDFLKDEGRIYHTASTINTGTKKSTIEQRNIATTAYNDNIPIVNSVVNDVAMTVLDDAPVDQVTGLPVPTVAVATDGGTSVIDGPAGVGTVVDSSDTSAHYSVTFNSNNNLYYARSGENLYYSDSYDSDGFGVLLRSTNTIPAIIVGTNTTALAENVQVGDEGVMVYKNNFIDVEESMVAYITSEYNTGWMKGDIKGCFLSNTTEETAGVDTTTEHVVNGDFTNDSDWLKTQPGSSTVTIAGGVAELTNVDGTPAVYQAFTTEVDQIYVVTADNPSATNCVLAVSQFSGPNVDLGQATVVAGGSGTLTFKAIGTTTYVNVYKGAVGTTQVDNVSVKRVQNTVENGEFSSDRSWTKDDGWSIVSGVASVDGSQTATASLLQDDVLTAGKTYKITYTLTISAGQITPVFGQGGGLALTPRTTGGTYTEIAIVPAAIDPARLLFVATSITVATIDDVEVHELSEPDRSVNDNPLQVVGQITKEPVATGSDLVGYTGFGGSDYLVQPYNSGLDFGTGGFHVCGWVKTPHNSSQRMIVSRGTEGSASGTFQVDKTSDEKLRFLTKDSLTSILESNSLIPEDEWFFFCVTREGTSHKIYINGKLDIEDTLTTRDVTLADAKLYFGVSPDTFANLFAGSLSLIRVGSGAPTEEQVKYMYQQEKHLFQENAKCVLTGSANVEDISYNRETKEYSAANRDYIDIFRGLSKVDTQSLADVVNIDTCGNKYMYSSASNAVASVGPMNLREELESTQQALAVANQPLVSLISSGVGQTLVKCDAGYKPEMVYDSGLLVSHTVTFDGFYYYANIPASSGDVLIMQRRIM